MATSQFYPETFLQEMSFRHRLLEMAGMIVTDMSQRFSQILLDGNDTRVVALLNYLLRTVRRRDCE